ncbi:MAG: hypothetical protein JWO79_4355, partial [Actinomycetia bacterium]|nr:hypothetical protein [Actinomycetes bacterium]
MSLTPRAAGRRIAPAALIVSMVGLGLASSASAATY